MRVKDINKQHALFAATIKWVNEKGFAASSVSKIAKEAGVSPATLYIYYANKEELLAATYTTIKKELGEAILKGFDSNAPLYDILQRCWQNTFEFWKRFPHYLQYAEQFANTPYIELVDKESLNQYFVPLLEAMNEGIRQKIIKDAPLEMFAAHLFHIPGYLSNPWQCKNFVDTRENRALAFEMAWDAIKK